MIFVDVNLAKSSWDLLKDERRRNQELKQGQQPQYWARKHGQPFKGPCTVATVSQRADLGPEHSRLR